MEVNNRVHCQTGHKRSAEPNGNNNGVADVFHAVKVETNNGSDGYSIPCFPILWASPAGKRVAHIFDETRQNVIVCTEKSNNAGILLIIRAQADTVCAWVGNKITINFAYNKH